jgi:hypothetical protein
MLRTRRRVLPITKSELLDITEDWVESAFKLEEKDLAYMERLVMLQNKRGVKAPTGRAGGETPPVGEPEAMCTLLTPTEKSAPNYTTV